MLSLEFDKLKTFIFQLWVLCHFQTFALLQQNLFCLNFCGQFSLCESLIKGRILMYRVHDFFFLKKILKYFTELSNDIKYDSKLVFAFDNAFLLYNFIVFDFDHCFIILCKKWLVASLIGMMHQAISWNFVVAHVRYQQYIFLF